MKIQYFGNIPYCYANSLAMVLSSIGEPYDPGYLQCLTTMGVGAVTEQVGSEQLPFFDSFLPDQGISLALETLGFAFEHHYSSDQNDTDGSQSIARLSKLLSEGPVIVGPLDMGLLSYNPTHQFASGSDHYFVVYDIDDKRVWFHDPAGFPHVEWNIAGFIDAWRAKAIGYRMGSFGMWGNLRRESRPAPEEIFRTTNKLIGEHLRQGYEQRGNDFGAPLIHRLAASWQEGVPPGLIGHLTYFAFPPAARSSADLARFYGPYYDDLATIHDIKGRHFGEAFSALRREDFARMSHALHEIADCEKSLFEAVSA